MIIKGTVNVVTNPVAFFTPVLAGQAPSSGYGTTDSAVTVILTLSGNAIFWLFYSVSTVVDTSNGSFTFDVPDSILPMFSLASLRVTYYGMPYYRSATFPWQRAGREPLNIWIYPANLPTSDGITAGQISTALANSSLPGNTSLKVNQNGLSLSGSKSQVSLEFGLLLTPDISPNLGVFFDLGLNGYDISVGWPEDWCESPDDVLNSIRSALQNEGSAVNSMASTEILGAWQTPPLNLTRALANKFFNTVAIQFIYTSYPNTHSWSLSNKTDKTVVILPQPCIGYPRAW